MQLQINDIFQGFRLMEQKQVKEMNSLVRVFVHEKTGAKLMHVENEDDNKVFSITFRTPPNDSTGLPHILEHSVLCGSRKFPTKDPFVELAKGSLNTYLNAMTFSDKTMYPVASRNEKDFFNLMDVYLDAVFYPAIYEYPETLMQEGWHYHLEQPEEDITYKGVVYNEMKGAFSSPESILFRKIQETLFPDTPYGVESGGDPEFIPELTQREFLEFHKKYYHPSNSYILLYGNGDIEKQLKFINEEYLQNFGKINVYSEIPIQKPFGQIKDIEIGYPISPEESDQDKTFLSYNLVIGQSTDPELYLAFQMLEYLLLETPAAPLKKALLEAEIGKDVFGSFDTSILQPAFSIVVKNSNIDKKEQFKEIIDSTLQNLVKQGIDKKLIEAAINSKEFALREADYRGFSKGLLYAIKSMNSWLYDEEPLMHLEYEPTLEKIKSALTTDYFEKLIDQYLLHNTHGTLLVLKPQRGLAEQKAKQVNEKLKNYKASLSKEEIDVLVKQTIALTKRQMTPDRPEDIEKIPMLSLEDIDPKAEELVRVEKQEQGIPTLQHPVFTNEIMYLNLYFDMAALDQELIPYAGMLVGTMVKMSTDQYNYGDLSNEINIHTGGINIFAEVYGEKENANAYHPKFIFKSKALADKLPQLVDLLREIIGHTQFDDSKRLLEIIREMKSRMEMAIFDQGHAVSSKRLLSYFSDKGKYTEMLKGLEFYEFVVDLEKQFAQKSEEIIQNLKKAAKVLFNKNNLLISITCEEKDYSHFQENLPILLKGVGNEQFEKKKYQFDLSPLNEGLMTQGNVQYVAKGYNFMDLGYHYCGSMQVLKTIIGLDYLWTRVRVQGGAYGAFISFARSGNMYFVSYRDPNLKETLKVYDEVTSYLNNFKVSERDMTKYIIGTMSKVDFPLTPSMKGEHSTAYYIGKITQEDIQKERDEILQTKKEDVQQFEQMMKELTEKDYICVMGNQEKIKQNQDVFGQLVDVFQ